MSVKTPKKFDSKLANTIGQAVLTVADRYQQRTNKSTLTILVRITGKLPTSPLKPGFNQIQIAVEVKGTPKK
jgi:hypothetical protein